MDRGETASFEYLGTPSHLPDDRLIHAAIAISWDNRRFNLFISLVIDEGSVMLSQTRNQLVVAMKTYRGFRGRRQEMVIVYMKVYQQT